MSWFSYSCGRRPGKRNLRKEKFSLAHGWRVQFIMAGGTWRSWSAWICRFRERQCWCLACLLLPDFYVHSHLQHRCCFSLLCWTSGDVLTSMPRGVSPRGLQIQQCQQGGSLQCHWVALLQAVGGSSWVWLFTKVEAQLCSLHSILRASLNPNPLMIEKAESQAEVWSWGSEVLPTLSWAKQVMWSSSKWGDSKFHFPPPCRQGWRTVASDTLVWSYGHVDYMVSNYVSICVA